jgi:hypothetical protein
LSANPELSLSAAADLDIPRAYRTFQEMAAAESKRPDGIEVVSIVTPNHLHHAPAKAFLEAGIADGISGVQFINAAIESSRRGSAWIPISASQQ